MPAPEDNTIDQESQAAATDTSQAVSDAAPADVAAVPADPSAPKTMLEAIEKAVQPEAAKTDEQATSAASADAAKDPNKKPEQAAAEQKPGEKQKITEDDLKTPEGLSAKGQERFQKLANGIKERDEQLTAVSAERDRILEAVEPFRQTLQENNISQEQFSLAAEVVGKMNRGEFRGALADLDEQRRLIALQIGESLPGVDALSDFPDLRQAVDQFQITEARALEIARSRNNDHQRTQQAQRQEQQRDEQQQGKVAHDAGVKAVDVFCRQMQTNDLDFAKIEPILLEQIQSGLLNGIHPSRFAQVVQSAYKMIKASAGSNKTTQQVTQTLRPTGSASPGTKPTSMHEAMWGAPAA